MAEGVGWGLEERVLQFQRSAWNGSGVLPKPARNRSGTLPKPAIGQVAQGNRSPLGGLQEKLGRGASKFIISIYNTAQLQFYCCMQLNCGSNIGCSLMRYRTYVAF